MPASFMQILAEAGIDTAPFERGLEKMEGLAESATSKIGGKFALMATGAAAAIGGTLLVALESAIKKTADYGLEMEHLGNRLGMTAQQAAVLTGVLEKQGISGNVAARSFQIMAMEAKQTQESLDPFSTRLGKVLGTLRDTNGQLLNTSQIFDLARNKIQTAGNATQQLQEAQQIFGSRMAGQLMPILKMSNEEWERQKNAVASNLGPVNEAAEAALEYRSAVANLEQTVRGLQLEVGSKMLPVLAQWINDMQGGIATIRDFVSQSSVLKTALGGLFEASNPAQWGKSATGAMLQLGESVGLVSKGTTQIYNDMDKYAKATREAAAQKEREKEAQQEAAAEVERSERTEEQVVKLAGDRVKLAEKMVQLGQGSAADVEVAVQEKLVKLQEQRVMLQRELNAPGLAEGSDQELALQDKLMRNQMEMAEVVATRAQDEYKEEELHIRATGQMNLANEVELLSRKLGDERIVGDERLKIEGELNDKRKQLMEESVKAMRDLGMMSVDQEIDYRKQKAAQALGQGDVIGAAGELKKARDLQIKQADDVMQFQKQIRTVSLQEEIDFQKQKLAAVRGNAEEEMKVIGQIAELDKQMYQKRLELGLNYTNTIIDQYTKMQNLGKSSTGESMTWAQAQVDAQRKLIEETRTVSQIGQHGGTEEERNYAVQWSQEMLKRAEDMASAGKKLDEFMQSAVDTARDTLKAASGGEEVRAPGGPSPTVGSIMSSAEGLATQGLARGSDIPRLDTSFTDLAVRIRDALLGVIPNVQFMSNALLAAAQQIQRSTGGIPIGAPALGPGGQIIGPGAPGTATAAIQSSPGFVAPPTVGPGGSPIVPTPQVGASSVTGNGAGLDDVVGAIKELSDAVKSGQDDLKGAVADAQSASAQQVQEAIDAFRAQPQKVTVDVAPNTGDLFVSRIEQELSQ